MATMIPPDVERFTTEGEKQAYRFLKAAAKPDGAYYCWYLPDLQGREPDFILYSGRCGLVVLEVKDWRLEQIREADPHHFSIESGGRIEKRLNPLAQARGYLNQLMDLIKKDRRLVSSNPAHHGNPKIPLACGVIFSNIDKIEYNQAGLDRVIGLDKVFFWDDLHPASPICSDNSGACFAQALGRMFPSRFDFSLTGPELDHLRQLLFPMVRVDIPERQAEFDFQKRIARLNCLDHHQEALARQFDGGHRVLVGPSGCGKTLVLVHKAAFLRRYNPAIKTLLLVCFNITLVAYIKRLLAQKAVPLGPAGVQVMHFYQLCATVIGEPVDFANTDPDYYEIVVQEAVKKTSDCGLQFDAILVDEGQDFSDDMFRVVTGLLNSATNNLTIALDDNQNIYRKRSAWEKIGVQARGRVHRIGCVYRNTVEITRFASGFIEGQATTPGPGIARQQPLFPDFFDFHGPVPELVHLPDVGALCAFVARRIAAMLADKECPCSEIAVLYTRKTIGEGVAEPIPVMIENALADRGVMSRWAAQNLTAKQAYDITTNSVTISTIHSVKGMDFSCVFLLGVDLLDPIIWTEEQIQRLIYVGITRARYRLVIPYLDRTGLIDKLAACQEG